MTTLSIELPTLGLPDKTQDPKINTALTAIQTWANGNVGTVNLETGLLAGTWETTTLGAKVEETATYYTVRCRKENAGAIVRLRGAPKIKAGETLTAGEALLTLPATFRPSVLVALPAITSGSPVAATIATTGVITLSGNLTTGQSVFLDGLTFSLT